MDRDREIEIKRGLKHKYGDTVSDRRIFYLGHPRVLANPFYEEISMRPDTIIDEGCGPGDDTRQFKKDGFSPTGVDMNENGFKLGYDWYKDRNKNGKLFRVGDVTRPEFPGNSFRYSYSGSLIHTLGTKEKAKAYLSEAYRILIPGGILFGGTISGVQKEKGSGYKTNRLLLLAADELAELIEHAGMKVLGMRTQHVKRPDLTGFDFLDIRDPEDDIVLRFKAEK